MSWKKRVLAVSLVGLIALIAAAFPLWRPLFFDDVVDEPFPELGAELQTVFREQLSEQQQEAYVAMREENADMAAQMAAAALGADDEAVEDMPDMIDPVKLAEGSFVEIDFLHGAEGTATIYQLDDGARFLRFENFRSTNGPALSVILTRHPDPRSRSDVGDDYLDLGSLKGNVGNQNYEIPADVDLSEYNSVVIYCVPFHVVFSAAALSPI